MAPWAATGVGGGGWRCVSVWGVAAGDGRPDARLRSFRRPPRCYEARPLVATHSRFYTFVLHQMTTTAKTTTAAAAATTTTTTTRTPTTTNTITTMATTCRKTTNTVTTPRTEHRHNTPSHTPTQKIIHHKNWMKLGKKYH